MTGCKNRRSIECAAWCMVDPRLDSRGFIESFNLGPGQPFPMVLGAESCFVSVGSGKWQWFPWQEPGTWVINPMRCLL